MGDHQFSQLITLDELPCANKPSLDDLDLAVGTINCARQDIADGQDRFHRQSIYRSLQMLQRLLVIKGQALGIRYRSSGITPW